MNIFTVDVEEYYHVEAFSPYIDKKSLHNYPVRVEKNIVKILQLLESYDVQATFFVLACLAEKHPGLIKQILDSGHEIASHGYEHKMIKRMTPEEFDNDIRKSREVLEDMTGKSVMGYRAPTFSIVEDTSWVYETLQQRGFRYSSSVFPIRHDRYGWPEFGNVPRKMAGHNGEEIWEIPLSVWSLGPVRIPFGGGGYLRAYPLSLTRALMNKQIDKNIPVVVYIHPWELDDHHPKIEAPLQRRLRHYIGISRMEHKIRNLLRSFAFGTMRQFLHANAKHSA